MFKFCVLNLRSSEFSEFSRETTAKSVARIQISEIWIIRHWSVSRPIRRLSDRSRDQSGGSGTRQSQMIGPGTDQEDLTRRFTSDRSRDRSGESQPLQPLCSISDRSKDRSALYGSQEGPWSIRAPIRGFPDRSRGPIRPFLCALKSILIGQPSDQITLCATPH